MNSNGKIEKNIYVRIKPPYDNKVTFRLQGLVLGALKDLETFPSGDNKKPYEKFCIQAIGEGDTINVYEWGHYWNFWHQKFLEETDPQKRESLFEELILDIAHKGFLPQRSVSLLGNMNSRINDILEKQGYRLNY